MENDRVSLRNHITDNFKIYSIINEAAFTDYCIDCMKEYTKGKYKKIDLSIIKPSHLKREGIKESYYKSFYEFFDSHLEEYPDNLKSQKMKFRDKIENERREKCQ